MWEAKIKIEGSESLIGSAMKKSGASGSGYPISSKQLKDGISVFFMGILEGTEEQKDKFIEEIKKHPRMIHFEREGDQIISQILEPLRLESSFNPHLIHTEPVVIKEDGTEYWSIGSWKREHLTDFIESLEKSHNAELIKISKKKITNFSFISSNPPISIKQKMAIELAIKEGYYKYPRKIELRKLAKISGISYSTYQAHLRKAEMKLIPFSLEKAI
jgi:predicted DNA binding protein